MSKLFEYLFSIENGDVEPLFTVNFSRINDGYDQYSMCNGNIINIDAEFIKGTKMN